MTDMKTFFFCPESVAQGCSVAEVHTHIAIASPGGKAIQPKCGMRTFYQKFHDLDPAAIKKTETYREKPEKGAELIRDCFTEAQALEIVAFVEPLDGLVIVNCEAGVSRSPGLVLALRRKYGGDTEECYRRAHPNIHVASLLGQALGVGSFEARPAPSLEDWFREVDPARREGTAEGT